VKNIDFLCPGCKNTNDMSISDNDKCWYAIRVRTNNEHRVSSLLKDKLEIISEVPSQTVWKYRNGRKITATKPLLSTYVFVYLDIKKFCMKTFFSIGNIFGFVSNHGKPAPIPDRDISALKRLSVSDKPVYEYSYNKLIHGEKVVVVGGPLRGAIGTIIEIDQHKGQFVVALDFFKRALVTELEFGVIQAF